jgi:hypothetical protein
MNAMNLRECYAILEIHEGAGMDDIRQAYRDLVTIWHPDQYQGSPRLREKATERLKQLNAAYEMLMTHGKAENAGPARHPKAPEKRPHTYTSPRNGRPIAQARKPRPLSLWIVLLAAVLVTILALYVNLPFPLPGRTNQTPFSHGESSVHALATARLDAEQVAGLQQELLLMGYASGPADGKMGPQTIRAAQQFATDF